VAALTIPPRFNGPPGSANGGYTCGAIATDLGWRTAEVSLRAPPPLDTALDLREADGGVWELTDGETVIALARRLNELDLDVPMSATPAEAADASDRGYDDWSAAHPFPTCFACGPRREPGDGLRIFPGALAESEACAANWTPHESLAKGDEVLAPELVWAALDCPSSAPLANWGQGPPIVLARLEAQLEGDVTVGRDYAIVSWQIARDGRKRTGGAALLNEHGEVLGRSRALWIELKPE
jgi:hypothetical protein